jgi:hypothetical protein
MAAAAAELIDLTASDGEDEREKPAWTCAGCVRVRCAGGAPALATSRASEVLAERPAGAQVHGAQHGCTLSRLQRAATARGVAAGAASR